MLQRSDVIFALVIGFVFGWLLIPILANFGFEFGGFAFFLPIAFAVFAAVSILAAWMLAKFWPPVFQFAKFAAVGALNFAIDFGILNIFILATGIATGLYFVIFKAASVAVAVVNSYLWNKFWTFADRDTSGLAKEFAAFLIVSLIGIGINVGAAHVIVNIMGPVGGIGPKLWANIGALSSVVLTLFWNFLGYKFVVFKSSLPPPNEA